MNTLTYVYHDCFVYSTPKCNIVFDFWKRPEGWVVPRGFAGTSPLSATERSKPLYVLVSHFHKDHYNKEIFSWVEEFDEVWYIISADVARHARHILKEDSLYKGIRPKTDHVIILREMETWSDELVRVDAYGSTDIGNSYVVEVGGKTLFHAGDLNAWIWIEESTPEEVEQATKAFLTHLKKIERAHPAVDIAMFPVDSRIGTDYYRGARLLLQRIETKYFLPMHFELGDTEEEIIKRHRDALAIEGYANREGETVYVGLTAAGDTLAF